MPGLETARLPIVILGKEASGLQAHSLTRQEREWHVRRPRGGRFLGLVRRL